MKWKLTKKEAFATESTDMSDELTDNIKDELIRKAKEVITVGDYTSFKADIPRIDMCLFDRMTERRQFDIPDHLQYVSIKNPAGEISEEAFEFLTHSMTQREVELRKEYGRSNVVVSGEEDLLVLPLILFAEQDTLILFGDPFKKCTRYISVNPTVRYKALELMNKYGVWLY